MAAALFLMLCSYRFLQMYSRFARLFAINFCKRTILFHRDAFLLHLFFFFFFFPFDPVVLLYSSGWPYSGRTQMMRSMQMVSTSLSLGTSPDYQSDSTCLLLLFLSVDSVVHDRFECEHSRFFSSSCFNQFDNLDRFRICMLSFVLWSAIANIECLLCLLRVRTCAFNCDGRFEKASTRHLFRSQTAAQFTHATFNIRSKRWWSTHKATCQLDNRCRTRIHGWTIQFVPAAQKSHEKSHKRFKRAGLGLSLSSATLDRNRFPTLMQPPSWFQFIVSKQPTTKKRRDKENGEFGKSFQQWRRSLALKLAVFRSKGRSTIRK